MQQINRN